MTYRGKEKFRSTFGGFISLVIICILAFLFSYKLKVMVDRTQSQVKKNTLVKTSNSYSPPENLAYKNNTIAFMLSDFFGDGSLDDPKYGKFTLD
jgi:hypothetical protein